MAFRTTQVIMAKVKCTAILILFMLACVVMSARAVPQPNADFPHLVNLDLNNLLLYNLAVKGMTHSELNDDELRSVLIKILNRHHMTVDHFLLPAVLSSLRSKLKRMFQTVSKCVRSGGTNLAHQLKKWRESVYNLKLPHVTGSPTKRKLETDLERESKRRRSLETELNDTKAENHELERQVERLKNPVKRKKGQRGRGKGKLAYKKSQRYKKRANNLSNMKDVINSSVEGTGFTPVSLKLRDSAGKIVTLSFEDGLGDEVTAQDIDEMLFILDTFNIPLKGYHEIAQRYSNLPRLNAINTKKQSLNDACPVDDIRVELGDQIFTGVVRSITESLTSTLTEKPHLIKDGHVRIKLSGDGTKAGKKKHLVNFTYTIIDEDTCKAEQGNYLLAIVRCPETNECLKEVLNGLVEEFNNLSEVIVDGNIVHVDKYLGGDLKFLNQVTGIASFAATHSCLWCKCPKDLRFDMSQNWSMSDPSLGARTIEEICALAKKKRLGCTRQPLFTSVPIVKTVPDTLHLFIRIADQLIYQIIKFLQDKDEFVKLTAEKLKTCRHLNRFEKFVKEIRINDWNFWIKDGKLEYDSFTGPEHRRIMAKINFQELIPDHPKLNLIESLWSRFGSLMDKLDQDMSNDQIDEFEKEAKQWCEMYGKEVYLSKDVTPYMHILAFHLPEAMRLHGNVVNFCQQGLEKLNHLVTKWYFRSTNFGKNALKQIMHKQQRIRTLEGHCRRPPAFNMTCTKCKNTGHNKRTCDQPRDQ